MKKLIAIILAILLCFIHYFVDDKSAPAKQTVLRGVCVYVYDGDTLKVHADNKDYKVRLKGIDAPEKGQAYGKESLQELMWLCHKKNVEVHVLGKDKYGRVLGKVVVNNLDVNAEMVSSGAAWHYKYSKDKNLASLEKKAREERLGLWSAVSEPVAPWDFRKSKSEKNSEKQ